MTTVLPIITIFLITFSLTIIFEKRLIPMLKSKAKQPIYSEGPAWHMTKQGTPTMGGLGFLFSSAIATAISLFYLFSIKERYFALSLGISFIYATMNAAIGIIDDAAKIRKRENAGLSPIQKLLLQTAAASLFMLARRFILLEGTSVFFSFGEIELGVFYYPLCILMLLGTVNCANLTDGIDGLATGVAFAIFTALSYYSSFINAEVSVISVIMMAATLAFLTFNLHPARIFMGDTGSLFLGSLTATCCFSLGNPLLIFSLGIVYVTEGLSVIIQVLAFKTTGKRVFKMAPLHHHLEKCGWSENKIVIWAIIITLLAAIPASFLLT